MLRCKYEPRLSVRSLMSAAWAVFVVDAAGAGWRIRLPEVYANVARGTQARSSLHDGKPVALRMAG